MSKAFWRDLQTQLLGEVSTAEPVRAALSVDGGIYRIMPEAAMYPRNTADIRKTVRLLATRAEAGRFACVAPRGGGGNLNGSAIGPGLQIVLPAHMHELLRLTKNTA